MKKPYTRYKIQNTRYNYLRSARKGFTLIEVLVAMTIFVTTLILLSQIYVSAMRSERVAYALLQNEEAVRYALDTMSKTIRMGKDFTSHDGTTLSFKYYYKGEWQPIIYSFEDNTIKRSFMGTTGPLLPEDTKITSGSFDLQPWTNISQALIKIYAKVKTKVGEREYGFDIQTAVTPRTVFHIND